MYCFKKLKENRDFRRIYGRGESFVHPAFVTYALKNRTNNIRMGITAGKKFSTAVARNRAKRVLTAAFSECAPKLKDGYDFVFVARVRILNSKSTEISAAMMKIFEEAGITKNA